MVIMDVKSSIPRCPHGMYNPDGDGLPARYCTLCTEPPEISQEEKLKILGNYTPWPHGKQVCPICGSKEIRFVDDYNFSCPKCGFDAMSD
jgi:hypothetical protein